MCLTLFSYKCLIIISNEYFLHNSAIVVMFYYIIIYWPTRQHYIQLPQVKCYTLIIECCVADFIIHFTIEQKGCILKLINGELRDLDPQASCL